METETEEFSFPIVADRCTSFLESPPLWRVSPSTSPSLIHGARTTANYAKNQQGKDHKVVKRSASTKAHSSVLNQDRRKSFSSVEGRIMKTRSEAKDSEDDDDEEEEDEEEEEEEDDKMDILWENLNEEMWKDREKIVKYNVAKGDIGFDCVPCSLKLSKNNGSKAKAMIYNKKPTISSILVIMKVLKKMFLLQHTQRSVKNRSW